MTSAFRHQPSDIFRHSPVPFCTPLLYSGKFSKEDIQPVSVTNHFKFEEPDGKQRAADALDASIILTTNKTIKDSRCKSLVITCNCVATCDTICFPYSARCFQALRDWYVHLYASTSWWVRNWQ